MAASGNHPTPVNVANSLEELRHLSNEVFMAGGRGLVTDNIRDKDHSWLNDLQEQLGDFNSKLQEVETGASQFNAHTNFPIMGGNLDADPHEESFIMYSDLAKNYRWLERVREYASGAAVMLGPNVLKRSASNIAKSRRKPQSTCHEAKPMILHRMIDNYNKMFGDMKATVSWPGDSQLNAIVEVHLDRTLKAVLIFKGLMIEWVVVKGWREDLIKPDGQVDIWGESRYQVFQRITENANAAMLNFQSSVYPDLAVKSFMTYLHSFISLFSDKCKQCGNHLHNNMPPTWREFRTLEPFHEDCRV